jgi:hypothetical protein
VSPIASDFVSLHLRAGDLLFFVDPEGSRLENLLVAPRRRDAFLQQARASRDRCTAILACDGAGCADRLSVDGGAAGRIPLRTAHAYWFIAGEREAWLREAAPDAGDPALPWLDALVAVSLAAGEHVLEFSAAHLDGKGSLALACRPGEVGYVVIHASLRDRFWRRQLTDWRFERSDAMPASLARRPLVLLDDGRWLVDAEPAPD